MKTRYKILVIGIVIIVLILFILPVVITLGTNWYCNMIYPVYCVSWSITPPGISMIQILFCEIDGKKWNVFYQTCQELDDFRI